MWRSSFADQEVVLGGMKENDNWKWKTSNTPFTYSNWKNDGPSGNNKDCITLESGEWSNVDCGTEYNYACQIPELF